MKRIENFETFVNESIKLSAANLEVLDDIKKEIEKTGYIQLKNVKQLKANSLNKAFAFGEIYDNRILTHNIDNILTVLLDSGEYEIQRYKGGTYYTKKGFKF